MLYVNANIFSPGGYIYGGFRIKDGKFSDIIFKRKSTEEDLCISESIVTNRKEERYNTCGCAADELDAEVRSDVFPHFELNGEECVDLLGCKVIPGLIDIHTHGNSGADFSDGDIEGLKTMANYYARNGITSFLATSMSLPYETLGKAFKTAKEFVKEQSNAVKSGKDDSHKLNDEKSKTSSRLLGINMEGPFLSKEKCGAQNKEYLKAPDFDAFKKLYDDCGGLIKIINVAPELNGCSSSGKIVGTTEFVQKAKDLCIVSAAHTNANYEKSKEFFDAGATHLTHLFNAMTPIHHREAGVIGAASERDNVFAELICDGYHVSPSAVRMAFKLFPNRICLISDSLRSCGMDDGEYELGGQKVIVKNGMARLADGTIAGASKNLYQDMLSAIKFGIPETQAIAAATINPAKSIGMEDSLGAIEPGKLADFLICNKDLDIIKVCINGGI